ncbi:MAG: hypothetical protein WCC76_05040 [Candidatus Acidiferrales bacterium]
MNRRRAERAANVVVHAGFVLAGIVTTLLGPILPILIARWSLSDEHAGLFFTLQFLGNIAGILSLGALISRRGYGATLAIGFGLIAAGIAALNSGSELAALAATALFGYGLGLTLSGTNLWGPMSRGRREHPRSTSQIWRGESERLRVPDSSCSHTAAAGSQFFFSA